MATYTTLADAQTAAAANADWLSSGSATKAKTFIDACRYLLLFKPTQAAQGDVSTQFDTKQIASQMDAAQQFVNDVAAGGGSVTDVSFQELRT